MRLLAGQDSKLGTDLTGHLKAGKWLLKTGYQIFISPWLKKNYLLATKRLSVCALV